MDPETRKLQIQRVVDLPGKTGSELFALAQDWVVQTFRDSSAVTQQSDPERGKLTVRAYWTGMSFGLLTPDVWFDAIIETKDGRYRVTFTSVRLKGYLDVQPYEFPLEQSRLYTKGGAKQIARRAEFEGRFHRFTDSLRSVMERSVDDESEDW